MRVDRDVKLTLQGRSDGISATIKIALLLKMFRNKNTTLSVLGHNPTSKTFDLPGIFEVF